MKWYEDIKTDEDIIISSRVRLARNLRKYPFAAKLSRMDADAVLKEVKDSVLNDRTPLSASFKFYDMMETDRIEKLDLMERHLISPDLVERQIPSGVLVMEDESVSIMINEEDHVRIQTFVAGDNIEAVYDLADKIDNMMGETLDYAFDDKYGFITSCPTNIGTGLRASFMMHLPCHEKTGNIKKLISQVSKYGVTVRGIYGEGSESVGSIYQISNQITLGKSEAEIIEILKKVGNMIKENEIEMRNHILKNDELSFEDEVYRSYGILTNAKKISAAEAMKHLSNVRLGYLSGMLKEEKPKIPVNHIMIEIQPEVMRKKMGTNTTTAKRDAARAAYINKLFEK